MPEFDKIDARAHITTTYAIIRDKFREKVYEEKNKYPLSAREELFFDVIVELLDILDYSVRNHYDQ